MPQLDSLSFFNQLFWFIVVFLVFYGLCITIALPILAKVLKVRFKLLNSLSNLNSGSSFNLNSKKVFFNSFNSINSFFTLVFDSFSLDANLFKKTFKCLYLTFARNLAF